MEESIQPILLKDLGMKFATPTSKIKTRFGLYKCQLCGKEWETNIQSVKRGTIKSCGCQSRKNAATHNLSYHRLYNIWSLMKRRCYNPKDKAYSNYGAKGVKVCDRWLDINNFIEDMYPSYQEGLTLDRIDVGGNYEPDNCRWGNSETQNRNTRDIQSNNTSGYRGVCWSKRANKWVTRIKVSYKQIYLGSFETALEAAKAYETYVRQNNLEHNFTPVLTEEEIEKLNIKKEQ